MKTALCTHILLLTFLSLPVSANEFINGQAADLVIGQEGFETSANSYIPTRINNPVGVALDPATGKVFVVARSDNRILRYASLSAKFPEAVFGQSNFTETAPSITRKGLHDPYGIHIDVRGRLWVADEDNSRVLCWVAAATRATGAEADFVFGKDDFETDGATGGADGMDRPGDVWVDADDNLWVADSGNHRVLRFDDITSKSSGADANIVLGQINFAGNTGGTSSDKMQTPTGLTVDPSGTLWVADFNNNRVLRFDNAASKATSDPADGVLGQSVFNSLVPGTTQNTMRNPIDVLGGADGTLWVADLSNRRVLGFAGAAGLGDGAPATTVLGQQDFDVAVFALDARTLGAPGGITIGASGSLVVTDNSHDRVLRFSPIPDQPVATNTALLALKAQLLAKAKKIKKKAKAAQKKGRVAKAKKLKAKAKKLIKRARGL